jgi:hypothetical protein
MTTDSDSPQFLGETDARDVRTCGESPRTVKQVLQSWFPERDIEADLERALVRTEAMIDGLSRNLASFLADIWSGIARLERLAPVPSYEELLIDRSQHPLDARLKRLAPVPGYEELLIERGQHPLVARMMSRCLMDVGASVTEAGMERKAVTFIRFLTKPGRRKGAICRRVGWLIREWDKSSGLLEGSKTNLCVHEFTSALEAFAREEPGAGEVLQQAAAGLTPHLSLRRGPKAGKATMAHEAWLYLCHKLFERREYTWDLIKEDFADRLTTATRLAFRDPDFDPRPALRRGRRRGSLAPSRRRTNAIN